METRIFSYHWSIKVLKWFFIFGIIVFFLDMVGLVISMFNLADAIAGRPDNAFLPAVIVLFITIVFSNFCIFAIDHFPEIAIDRGGVSVRYLLRMVYIPWNEIVRLENLKIPLFSKNKDKFVSTKKFPFWYRTNNLISYWLFKPGFIISTSIIDFEELSAIIQSRISTN